MHNLIVALGGVRAPILVTLLALCMVILPDQSREVFRVIRETGRLAGVQAVLATVACALVIGACTLVLVQRPSSFRLPAVDRYRAALESLPIVLALSLVLGSSLANVEAGWLAARPHHILTITAFAAAAAAAALMWRPAMRKQCTASALAVIAPALRLSLWQGLAAITIVIGSIIAAVVQLPWHTSVLLGPIGVIMLFFATLCIAGSLLGYIYDRHQVPVIAILGAMAVVWASVPTNDNHELRLASRTAAPAPDVKDAFKAWLLKRLDRTEYLGRPYPVYIVTAEGNGLYAAAHAALRLAAIQDSCPAFARHVFAISSVSGGSLGAAVFAALVKAHPIKAEARCPLARSSDRAFQDVVRSYFNEDVLTPLIAAGLFPDFFQRFWPTPIPQFDRARALEDGFDRAWRRIVPGASDEIRAIFSSSSRDLWSASADRPALLLNTTVVHNGQRITIAPFQLQNHRDPFHFNDKHVDIFNDDKFVLPLHAAVSTSARFPLATPPAVYKEPRSTFQLVDGAYYENSGVFTAMDLVGRLRHAFPAATSTETAGPAERPASACAPGNLLKVPTEEGLLLACIKLVSIRASVDADSWRHAGEIWAPVAAMLEARQAKGRANLVLARALYCGANPCLLGAGEEARHIYAAILDAVTLKLPLGWLLSGRSLDAIARESAIHIACEKTPMSAPPTTRTELQAMLLREENSCLYSRISNDLKRR